MSKRPHVLLDERDFDELRALAAIRAAAGCAFPAGDIDSMLAEIARGVSGGVTVVNG